jgi:hypothetical protein
VRSWLRFQRRNSVAMVSKVSNISPKACTPIELRRVGVIFTPGVSSYSNASDAEPS